MKNCLLLLFIFSFFDIWGQNIELKNANSLKSSDVPHIQILTGDVILQHSGTVIYCDKANFNRKDNSFFAQQNVHVEQSNGMHIYGETLDYNGVSKYGKFRKNVKLVDDSMTLHTDFLDFSVKDNSGHFFNGGKIIDSALTLTSKEGYYFPDKKEYFFKDSVVVFNDKYTMYSDTLKYHKITKIVTFFGPTRIVNDENTLYCENGWYDTNNDIARFSKNSKYYNKEQTLWGDSLYYDRTNGIGKAFGNITLWDSLENIFVKGNFADYYEQTETSLVTDSAVFMQISDEDTLYLHADTLYSKYDTIGKYRSLAAYYHAKIYRYDFQSKCDSVYYSFSDSIIKMYGEPILWSEENQIVADFIEVYTKNNSPDSALMQGNAFITNQEDTSKFNQIKGDNMLGFFRNNELYRIDVNENGEALYFVKDGDELVGINKSLCKKMIIYLKQKKVKKILFLSQPTATLYPPTQLSGDSLKLENFYWYIKLRPTDKYDIFNWREIEQPTTEDQNLNKTLNNNEQGSRSSSDNNSSNKTLKNNNDRSTRSSSENTENK